MNNILFISTVYKVGEKVYPILRLLNDAYNIDVLNISIKSIILGTVGVKRILSFNSNVDTTERVYTINFIVTTNDDTTIQSLENYRF